MTTCSLTRSGKSFKPEQWMSDVEQEALEIADGGRQEEDPAQVEHRGEGSATQLFGMEELLWFMLHCEKQMGWREEQMERERTEMRERSERLMTVVECTHTRLDTELLMGDEHKHVTVDPLKLT